jgi:hypothetical protein
MNKINEIKQKNNVQFNEIAIKYDNSKYRVFYVVKNNRSQVMDAFRKFEADTQDKIKALINDMAVLGEKFDNEKNIRWKLKKYDYGEIKLDCHRMLFFQKYENNIIFFKYLEKKGKLKDTIYKALQKEKDSYEKEFKRPV